MVRVFSLLLILGLALSPPARAQDEAEEPEAGGDDGEAGEDAGGDEKEPEEEIELEEAPEEDVKLEEKDEVLKKGAEAAEKGGEKMRGAFASTKVVGKRVIFGSKRVINSCGCGTPKFKMPDWEDLLKGIFDKGNVKKEDEMVMIIKTKDHYTYRLKAKSDLKTIYYVKQKHGKWPEWKKIDIVEDFDKWIGLSIIQFEWSGVQMYGLVQGRTVIAHGNIEEMPYVVNRMWLNYLASRVNERHPLKTVEITWKGRKYVNWPEDHIKFLLKPYFLPERQRRVYWVVVKEGPKVLVIPRPPKITIKYIKWPRFSFPSPEWHFPELPDSIFDKMCLLDEIGEDCVDSSELGPGGNSDGGDSSAGSVSFGSASSDILISTLPGEYSFQGQQGCTCQKRCKCTSGGPFKKRQKRATADSYKEFLELTKDCVSERSCRRAYTKFLKHGVIKVKSD